MKNDEISELIGDWGPWQRRGVILIYLCKIPSAWFMACIIFTAPIPKPGEYYCLRSDVSNENYLTKTAYPSNIVQNDANSMNFCSTKINQTYDEVVIANLSLMENEKHARYVPCTSFQFDTPFETTITKFNLVCSRSILIATSQFFHLFGVLTGGILATKLMET